MTAMTFSEQLHHLWHTRPVRIPSKGPGAGVAAGIGLRYNVDPVLVRVAFVVSAIFGGGGVLLYLAGWLLFTRAGDAHSTAEQMFGKDRGEQSTTKIVLVVVALVVFAVGALNLGMRGGGLFSFALMLGGWWLLYLRQPQPPTAPAATPRDPGGAVSAATATSPAPGEAAAGETWDPLGVAPMAWDLPEAPAGDPAISPRRRSRWTPATVGVAVLAGAGASAAAVAGVDWLTPARVGAVALTVVGIGLVIGAFMRRGFGLLLVALPLLAFVVLASFVGPLDVDRDAVGDRRWAPASVADLQREYKVNFGDSLLDLRSVRLTENRAIDLNVTAGELRVLLPAAMVVRTHCVAKAAQCPADGTHPNPADTLITGPVLDLNVKVRAGNVEIHHD